MDPTKLSKEDKKLPDPDPTIVIEEGRGEEFSQQEANTVPAFVPSVVSLFQHPDFHPIVIDMCLIKKYGDEWLRWEPETFQSRLPHDFKASGISALALAKIQACRTLHLVDTYWKQWEVFLPVTQAFNGSLPDFTHMQVPTVTQCAISVDIVNHIRKDVMWSSEINAYLGVVHIHDGFAVSQEPLDFVKIDASEYPIDVEAVKKRFDRVIASNAMPSGDSPEDEQLRRMLDVHRAVQANRETLNRQLKVVEYVLHRRTSSLLHARSP